MTRDFRPTQPDDLEDLARFLTDGFHVDPASDFAAVRVLRWKFLDPGGDDGGGLARSYLARDEAGSIVGHVGICRTSFEGASVAGGSVPTLHLIDWLGSPGHPGLGVSLMRLGHGQAPTQFFIGGSEAARAIGPRAGYATRPPISVYSAVLRPAHWLRASGPGRAGRWARFGRDLARGVRGRPRPVAAPELRPVSAFGDEVEEIAARAGAFSILTRRTAGRLNHLLAYPRGGMTGWHLVDPSGRIRGFAVLGLVPQHGGRVRLGKVADLVLDDPEPAAWHGAADSLRRELGRQGADVVQAFAVPGWVAEGFSRAGFRRAFPLNFMVRDRKGLLPAADVPMHITPLEADYAYT